MIELQEAVAVFERRRAAWLAEDLDTYLGMFNENIVFQGPAGEPTHGKAAFAALVRRSAQMVRPASWEFHEIAVNGSRVLAEWTIAIESRSDGSRYTWSGMSVCELRDGLITWWREYYDPAALKRDLLADGEG